MKRVCPVNLPGSIPACDCVSEILQHQFPSLRRERGWVRSMLFSVEFNAALAAPSNCFGVTKLGCRNGAANWVECSGVPFGRVGDLDDSRA